MRGNEVRLERKAGELLRIYLGEHDKTRGRCSYQLVLEAARRFGLLGGTVLQGKLGYGSHATLHHQKFWTFSENLPLVIEIVDTRERLEAFVPQLRELLRQGGLVTFEKVQIVRRLSGAPPA